jgi:hypothetical protein
LRKQPLFHYGFREIGNRLWGESGSKAEGRFAEKLALDSVKMPFSSLTIGIQVESQLLAVKCKVLVGKKSRHRFEKILHKWDSVIRNGRKMLGGSWIIEIARIELHKINTHQTLGLRRITK